MSVSASAVNLAQYANMSNDPLVKAVVMSLRDNGSVLTDLPIVTNQTLKVKGSRFEGNLPTVDWVKLNEEGSTTSGTPTPFEEQAYILRNYIDVDKALVMDKNQIQDPRAIQLQAYLKAVAYDINFKFINNTHESGDADAPIGIRKRLDGGTAYGTRSDCKITASALDLSTGGMTAATANTFLELLDQVLWAVDSQEGNNVVIYTNEVLKRRMARALRLLGASGGFSQTQDQYGRVVDKFRNAVVKDIGYKADQSTRIITVTEDTAGADASSTYTSLYAVNFGEGYASAWQMEPLKPLDRGLLENGTIYRVIIDWIVGLLFQNTRSIARLYDLKIS